MRTSEQLIVEYQLVRKKRDENIVKYNMQLLDNTNKKRNKYPKSFSSKYKYYLKRANDKQIEFSLTIEELDQLLREACVYCGDKSSGIDRIDSTKGYITNNTTSCCAKCNMMKYTHSVGEFMAHIIKIYQHNAIK